MNKNEFHEVVDKLKEKTGGSDEDVVAKLGEMYEDDKITKDQLIAMCEELGFEISPEFAEAPDGEESKKLLWQTDNDEGQGMSAKEKEEVREDPNGTTPPPAPTSGKEKSDEDDSGEREKALDYFK